MKKNIIVILVIALTVSSCDILNQLTQVVNFKNCTFHYNQISSVKLLNYEVLNMDNISDVGFLGLAKLTGAVAAKELPIKLKVDVDINNPNAIPASVSKFDWIFNVDGNDVISGSFNERVTVKENSKATVTIPIETELFTMLKNENSDAIISTLLELINGEEVTSRMTLKIRPSIMVGSMPLQYPGYLNVNF